MRRDTAAAAAAVFVIAVLVRAWGATLIPFPSPEDTAYYVGVARNLLEGRGLVSDSLWSYATPPLVFPRPAFEVWLPLPTFLAAIPMAVFGHSLAAAQVSSVLVGALVCVLAWRLAADIAEERGLPPGRARTLAVGTGVTAALYLPLVLHSALPDSTMPFAALVLGACLLMTRLVREPRPVRLLDVRVIGLGVVLGLAAWTRNEAAWLALTWAAVAWTRLRVPRSRRLAMVTITAAVAILVFAPWAIRDWLVFGSPFPGQAVTNAFSLDGRDIFAWSEEPTLARYLAAGPARLLELRVTGLLHNLLNVLLYLGVPLSIIGLLALPWQARGVSIRPLLFFSVVTFLVTSLLFPVATTWGTFLHGGGAVHVLLIVSALLALDAFIVRVGRFRGWTRPVAWLGPALGIAGAALFTVVALPGFGTAAAGTGREYAELARRLDAAGYSLGDRDPVITNFPVWVAETARVSTLALPDEPAESVLSLARHPTLPPAGLLVVEGTGHRHWPADIDAGVPGTECFREVDLGTGASDLDPLADTRVFEITCP